MGITEQPGGVPSLTAVLVISTGILGANLGPYEPVESAGHGRTRIGHGRRQPWHRHRPRRAGQPEGRRLAMGLNALTTTLLLPLLSNLSTDAIEANHTTAISVCFKETPLLKLAIFTCPPAALPLLS